MARRFVTAGVELRGCAETQRIVPGVVPATDADWPAEFLDLILAVKVVANADEAIAILEARKDIRIVFSDIDMPGSMDGLKLARAIRERWPPIELILTSGHFDVPRSDIPERGQFFSKPYRDEEIVSALRRFAS
jgi:CheY-like chemotaxis protein